MRIDEETCSGCGGCLPYCTVGAIVLAESGVAEIDADECVECNVCHRSGCCPAESFIQETHPYPRSLRAAFSDVEADLIAGMAESLSTNTDRKALD